MKQVVVEGVTMFVDEAGTFQGWLLSEKHSPATRAAAFKKFNETGAGRRLSAQESRAALVEAFRATGMTLQEAAIAARGDE